MKASVGFIFFMLFLAGLALVNLKGLENRSDTNIASAAEIVGSAWQPTHIGEMRLEKETPMFLKFDTDERVTGFSGCNRFFGTFRLVDGALEFGPLGSTSKACPEPENSFELSFLAALQSARSLSSSDDRLTMYDEKAVAVVRYIRAQQGDAR